MADAIDWYGPPLPLTPISSIATGSRVCDFRWRRVGMVRREIVEDKPMVGVEWDDNPGVYVAYPTDWELTEVKA